LRTRGGEDIGVLASADPARGVADRRQRSARHSGSSLGKVLRPKLGVDDAYYSDQRGPQSQDVATQLARQLAEPRPADSRTIRQLDRYKGLDARWTDWSDVASVCRSLAVEMVQ
jgi:hypothetical protein